MPRLYGRLSHIRFHQNKWTREFEKQIGILMRQAARAWLREVALQVPVWTGMAKGSVAFARGPGGHLARYLNVSIPIIPTHYVKGKNPLAGGRMGRYSFTNARHVWRFTFRTDVPHFILNEFYSTPVGPQYKARPWNIFPAANEIFQQTLRSEIKRRLPKIKSYIDFVDTPFGV